MLGGQSRQCYSEVQNHLFTRLRTANQDIAVGRRLKRFGLVAYRAGYQAAFAGVTDARPARPPHRNVAGFSKLQQTLILRVPCDGQAAACKGDLWSRAGRSGGLMGRSSSHSSYSRRDRFARAKDFGVDSTCTNAPGYKPRPKVLQKLGWAAKIEIGATWHAKLLDRGHIKVAGSIEVGTEPVLRAGPAVANMAAAMLQLLQ